MTHMTHIDSTNARDLTKATIEGRRQAHHLTEVFRKIVPGMENCYLISTAPALGLRESRRIEGEVTLTEHDMMSQTRMGGCHWLRQLFYRYPQSGGTRDE